jgi:hypothetical protein
MPIASVVSGYCKKKIKEMIEAFKQRITVEKFIRDGAQFEIKRKSDYLSYPEFIKYFSEIETITKHNLIIAINFTYGWMPTIFEFCSDNFEEIINILNRAKQGTIPTIAELDLLKGLLNNSLVGTSKLLHLINPSKFAIWDSRVYRYLTGNEPHEKRIGNSNSFLYYIEFCDYLIKHEGFDIVQKSIERKVGYSMTAKRITELVMFSNGAKQK